MSMVALSLAAKVCEISLITQWCGQDIPTGPFDFVRNLATIIVTIT